MHLLAAVSRWSGNNDTSRRAALTVDRKAGLLNNLQCRIVRVIANENYFEAGILLCENRADVFVQTAIHPATRDKDANEGRELRIWFGQFRFEITRESHATAKRNQTQPD